MSESPSDAGLGIPRPPSAADLYPNAYPYPIAMTAIGVLSRANSLSSPANGGKQHYVRWAEYRGHRYSRSLSSSEDMYLPSASGSNANGGYTGGGSGNAPRTLPVPPSMSANSVATAAGSYSAYAASGTSAQLTAHLNTTGTPEARAWVATRNVGGRAWGEEELRRMGLSFLFPLPSLQSLFHFMLLRSPGYPISSDPSYASFLPSSLASLSHSFSFPLPLLPFLSFLSSRSPPDIPNLTLITLSALPPPSAPPRAPSVKKSSHPSSSMSFSSSSSASDDEGAHGNHSPFRGIGSTTNARAPCVVLCTRSREMEDADGDAGLDAQCAHKDDGTLLHRWRPVASPFTPPPELNRMKEMMRSFESGSPERGCGGGSGSGFRSGEGGCGSLRRKASQSEGEDGDDDAIGGTWRPHAHGHVQAHGTRSSGNGNGRALPVWPDANSASTYGYGYTKVHVDALDPGATSQFRIAGMWGERRT
ncbi:hypothetical protein K438DRAFT_1945822 [Mycena galopus ATCC 62051]|nr:hypothetical protein K438DRAFT_1945822 [Mycena galopus ATCC 62051]